MIFKVFSVYDSKALVYASPFFSQSVGAAVRAFGDAANDPNVPFAKHPGDYQLYEIGTFDDNTGVMDAVIPMRLLGCAADFVSRDIQARVPMSFKTDNENNLVPAGQVSNGS